MLTTQHPIFQIGKDTWAISDFQMDTMYLLLGTQRALLIDTGLGIGDVEAVVRTITDLPLSVAMTHGHLDHAGGAGNFDQILIHPADVEVMQSITCQARQKLVYSSAARKNIPVTFAVEENLFPWPHAPNWEPLSDLQEIDLGSRTVTVLALPGHTRGSVAFLDEQTRYLFTGDACNFNLIMATPSNFDPTGKRDPNAEDRVAKYADTVETCLKSLNRLWDWRSRYDWNFTGHLDEIGNRPEGRQLLCECIQCCREILSKKNGAFPLGSAPQIETVGRATITYLESQKHHL